MIQTTAFFLPPNRNCPPRDTERSPLLWKRTSFNVMSLKTLMGYFKFFLQFPSLLSTNGKPGLEMTVMVRKANHPWFPSLLSLIPRLYMCSCFCGICMWTDIFFSQEPKGIVHNHAYFEHWNLVIFPNRAHYLQSSYLCSHERKRKEKKRKMEH